MNLKLCNAALLCVIAACASSPPPATDGPLRVFFTADEHGWLEGKWKKKEQKRYGGAELLLRRLEALNYQPANDLLLSGGDSWTGPAISTLLHGKPMIKLFNHLEYDAAALGNHEFDFGLETLEQNRDLTQFPLLAANVRWADSSRAKRPYPGSVIVSARGKKIGVIGLTNAETHKATAPQHVEALRFEPYEDAIRREATAVKNAGADYLVILMHDDAQLLKTMQSELQPMGLIAVLGGHVHRFDKAEHDGVVYCNPADKLLEFCMVTVVNGEASLKVQQLTSDDHEIRHPVLKSIIADAKNRLGALNSELLAELSTPLHARDQIETSHLGQLVGLAWLHSVPAAKVAITNHGALRQDLEPGKITRRHLQGVMPFNNNLVVVNLNEEQLKETMANPQSLTTGARIREGQVWIDGHPMGQGTRVSVVVNSFMYAGGNNYRLEEYDPNANRLHRSWRQPVAEYLKAYLARGEAISQPAITEAWKALIP